MAGPAIFAGALDGARCDRVFSSRREGAATWQRAFSLVELIGVLAILTILAVLVIPRISNRANTARIAGSVDQARVQQALASVQAVKTAATEHCAKFGTLASRNGTPLAVSASYDKYDAILLSEQLLDQPFSVRLGTGATVRLVKATGRSLSSRQGIGGGASAGGGAAPEGAYLLEAVIFGVPEREAKALNDALDGPSLGAEPGEDDSQGRVTYRGGDPGTPREVYISITRE
ncbi:MAG TPA: type II secretion system protein [Verrucomicrobiae bacterium]